jgi:hypothetical protein
MRLSLLIPLIAAVGLILPTLSSAAPARPSASDAADLVGHASGCFRVDAMQCCHAGPDRYHCH